jgi:hypothetical protein
MRRAAWCVLVIATAVAGCGGGEAKRAKGHVAGDAERAVLTQVVADFDYAYLEARPKELCGLFTDAGRAEWMNVVREGAPELAKVATCEKLVREAYSDPGDQPEAIAQASAFEFGEIRVDGDEATVAFPTGAAWRLQKVRGRWLIASAPMIPPSLADSA